LTPDFMAIETTLILLKPDSVSKKLCGKVLGRFEDAGLKLRGLKMLRFGDELLKEHYAHIASPSRWKARTPWPACVSCSGRPIPRRRPRARSAAISAWT
jgi:nucleoside diphosphate kinase